MFLAALAPKPSDYRANQADCIGDNLNQLFSKVSEKSVESERSVEKLMYDGKKEM